AVYMDILARPAGIGEAGQWFSRSGTPDGRLGVAADIVTIPEGRTDEVRGFYSAYLRPPLDSGGLQLRVPLLQNHKLGRRPDPARTPASIQVNDDAIIAGDILSSPEYFQDSQTLTTFAPIPGAS